MKKDADLLNWINSENAEQMQWANEYLAQRLPLGKLIKNSQSGLEISMNNHHHSVFISPEIKLLVNKMRAAWRQYKFRSKQNGKKTYSFVMSTNIGKQLKDLAGAGEGKVTKTLEILINNSHDIDVPKIEELKNINKELRSKMSDKEKENRRLRTEIKLLQLKSEMKGSDIAKLTNNATKLEREKADLFNQLKQLKEKHNNQFREEKAEDNAMDTKSDDA